MRPRWPARNRMSSAQAAARVIRLDAGEVSKLANVLSHRQPKVPAAAVATRWRALRGSRSALRSRSTDRYPSEAKHPSAMPAERANRDGHRGLRTGGFGYLAHQAVHAIGVTRENIQTAAVPRGRARHLVEPRPGSSTWRASPEAEASASSDGGPSVELPEVPSPCYWIESPPRSQRPPSGLVITDAMPRISRCDARRDRKSGRISRRCVMLKPSRADRLEAVVVVPKLQVVPEPQEIDATVELHVTMQLARRQ